MWVALLLCVRMMSPMVANPLDGTTKKRKRATRAQEKPYNRVCFETSMRQKSMVSNSNAEAPSNKEHHKKSRND
jgi:hypothetical protein